MALVIGGITVDNMIMPPQISDTYRARSVVYSLDGTALEDRLGGTKKKLTLPFGTISQSQWEALKTVLSQKNITVSGYLGSLNVGGTYRLADDEIPTPVLYVKNNTYMCKPFTVTIEEV